MASLQKQWLTPDQYLEIERLAETRSEYISGEMLAMTGNTKEHGYIVFNIVGDLRAAIRGGPCVGFASDMRAQATESSYFYPDVVLACNGPKFLSTYLDTLVNPTVVFDVLSKSTEAFDRGEKFRLYRSMQSLQQYVLVSADRAHVEWYTRLQDGIWNLAEADGLESSFPVASAGCVLRLADVYEGVEFGVKLAVDNGLIP